MNLNIKVISHSDTGLTGMIGDKEYKRLFVSNRSGIVFIYSISSVRLLYFLFLVSYFIKIDLS